MDEEKGVKDLGGIVGDFDLLIGKIFQILDRDLGFSQPAVAIYDKDFDSMRVVKAMLPPAAESVVQKFLGRSSANLLIPISEKGNVMVRSFLEQRIFEEKSVDKLAVPFNYPGLVKAVDALMGYKLIVVFPMIIEGKSFGVIAMGSKAHSHFTNDQKEFLGRLCDELGLYLRNTWHLKKTIEHNKNLSEKNEKLRRLAEVNRNFLLDIHEIMVSLAREFDLNDQAKQDMSNCISYLKSIYLTGGQVLDEKTIQAEGKGTAGPDL